MEINNLTTAICNKEMEDDDQSNQFLENLSEKVISIRTEESILQEASENLVDLAKARFMSQNQCTESESNEYNVVSTPRETNVVKLQKQVELGEITPFEAVTKSMSNRVHGTFDKTSQLLNLEKYLLQQAELSKQRKLLKKKKLPNDEQDREVIKKRKLNNCDKQITKKMQRPNRKIARTLEHLKNINTVDTIAHSNRNIDTQLDKCDFPTNFETSVKERNIIEESNHISNLIESETDSGSEYIPSDDQDNSDTEGKSYVSKKKSTSIKAKTVNIKRNLDDGSEKIYNQRVESTNCLKSNEKMHKIDNLFKVPHSIWKKLYRYQRVSVQWLWELHGRNLGGLLGDEMGLGKTVQVIAFLAGLECSELLSDGGRFRGLGPTLIVCPATLMEQWVKHFHEWWPILRIVVLHQSGTYDGNVENLINSLATGGVLITSYSGVLIHKDLLVRTQWHYVILDEGHKIRNPQAKVSKAVKEFSTPHRLLLTGSPMQNSLKELWSLFDFILPGKLGTLPAFLEHCASPITRGGYANASPLQEATALHMATMLKDAITPYMLRRTKTDVKHHVNLPEKNEQVLFCSLTEEQKNLYKKYLRSDDVSFVLHERKHQGSGRYKARLLIALSALRKICNHPDLHLYTSQIDSDDDVQVPEETLEKFGYWKRAGKMTVVRSLLRIWKKQGHRVLLFTQGRQMMHILESLIQQEKYSYLRLDGTTPMSQRQQIIHTFNNNSSYFIFLLTTRVGGLGVNLTGANRVIIYDPDWNPATDSQARERAWRIGQNKRVTIYRLITAGTIEEKMYHRQIFKLLLSNKVLEDPRQRRLFKTTDLAELFNLNEPIDGTHSESDRLFHDSKLTPTSTIFSSNKIEEMRKLATALSKSISKDTNCIVHESETVPSEKQAHTDVEINKRNNNENIAATLQEDSTTVIGNIVLQSTKICDLDQNLEKVALHDNECAQDMHQSLDIYCKSNSNGMENSNNSNGLSPNSNKLECKYDKGKVHHYNETEALRYKEEGRKKKISRRKQNKISALFEGQRISCLLGRRFGQSCTEDTKAPTDDQYVLKKLFAKSTVKSAFQHETVLQNAKESTHQENPMQRLARETAQESMDFVRQSRKWCWKPTWDTTLPHTE